MPTLPFALQKLTSAALIQRAPVAEVAVHLQEALDCLVEALPSELENALSRFGEIIAQSDLEVAANVALVCGSFVEGGSDPLQVFDAVLRRLDEALTLAVKLPAACEEMAARRVVPETPPAEGAGPVETYFPQLPAELRREIIAWQSLEYLCLPAIAMMSRSPLARRRARTIPDLLARANRCAAEHDKAAFLIDMLRVLDDENLFVFHPAQKKGFWVKVKGIADNFQLHTLLVDALVGDPAMGQLEGERLDERIIAAARDLPADETTPLAHDIFDLHQWPALSADGQLGPRKKEHRLRGEDVPATIRAFDGFRVVLLGTPFYPRQWVPQRRFPDMPGSVEVLQILDEERVQSWLKKMATHSDTDLPPPAV